MSEVTPFNLVNPIPKHRLVKIYDSNNVDIANGVPLIFNDEIGFKISSKYGQLWQGSSSNLLTILASKGIPSGQFALQGLQIWNSTDPIKLSFSVHIEMDTDPINEVLNPIKSIMCTVLPYYPEGDKGVTVDTDLKTGLVEKHFNLKLKTLVPPGPNIQTIVEEMTNGTSHAENTYTLKMGYFTFNNMIITGADPKFSKDVCYINGKAYPISADLSLDIESIEVATTNMINDILS